MSPSRIDTCDSAHRNIGSIGVVVKCLYLFSTLVTFGLLPLRCPSIEELGGGDIAEGLVRRDGVVGALPGQEGGDLQGEGG